MRRRPVVPILMLMIAMIPTLPLRAQHKSVGPSSAGPRPNAVRPYVACAAAMSALRATVAPGLSPVGTVAPNFSSAHADLKVGVRTVGAELKFSATTAPADPARGISATTAISSGPGPAAEAPKKPLHQVQVFALLAGGVPSHEAPMLVKERGVAAQTNYE